MALCRKGSECCPKLGSAMPIEALRQSMAV
jgi:hypothetical protein